MTSGRKLDKRYAVPGLALLGLFVIGAEAPLEGQARQTRSSGTSTSSAPRVQSSNASAPKATSSSSTRSTAVPRGSSSAGAARTRQSTPANRGRHGGGGRHYYPGYYHNYGLYFGYGGQWRWGGHYYYPYYYHPLYWGVPYYVPRRARQEYLLGAFDLNVRPKKTEVYLDGQFIGKAGQYDGFPEHLWLEEGSYELIFYRPGLATEKRVLSIYPGVVVDVRIRMEPGESVAPSELTTVDRTEGAMAEVRSAYERRQQAAAPPPPSPPPASAEMDTRAQPGRVKLNVVPADASVYLDGRLLGSGDELARLHAGLVVEPGSHLLEVVRPGYGTVRREFAVEGGGEVELEILLEAG